MYNCRIVGSGLYGTHIFHTNNKAVWDYVNRFTNSLVVNYKGELYSHVYLQYNMGRHHSCRSGGKDEDGNDLPKTVISREYSSEWKPGDEPYYPVNDEKNGKLYERYKALADAEEKVIFGGRLAEYRYYDMDQVVDQALGKAREILA